MESSPSSRACLTLWCSLFSSWTHPGPSHSHRLITHTAPHHSRPLHLTLRAPPSQGDVSRLDALRRGQPDSFLGLQPVPEEHVSVSDGKADHGDAVPRHPEPHRYQALPHSDAADAALPEPAVLRLRHGRVSQRDQCHRGRPGVHGCVAASPRGDRALESLPAAVNLVGARKAWLVDPGEKEGRGENTDGITFSDSRRSSRC